MITIINTGTSPNAGNGDSLRLAFTKTNNNFLEIANVLGTGTSTISQRITESISQAVVHNNHVGMTAAHSSGSQVIFTVNTSFNGVTIGNALVDNLTLNTNTLYVGGSNLSVIDGTLILNSSPVIGSFVFTDTSIISPIGQPISIDTLNCSWQFNNTGALILPSGGLIKENVLVSDVFGSTTTSITLIPGGSSFAGSSLEIYSSNLDYNNRIYVASDDMSVTDMFLGNDRQYFAVVSNGENVIRASNGVASPAYGNSAGSGGNVIIYGGNAGDNGGNVPDGASGGNITIQAGVSTIGLGGNIALKSATGPDGYGNIELSTEENTSWIFGNNRNLTCPPGGSIAFNSSSTSTITGITSIMYADGSTQNTAWLGSVNKSIQTVIVSTSTVITADVVFADPNAAGSPINLVLPSAPANGTVITVKNINSGSNSVYIQTNGIDNMETETGSIGSGVYATIGTTGGFITWIYDVSASVYRIIG